MSSVDPTIYWLTWYTSREGCLVRQSNLVRDWDDIPSHLWGWVYVSICIGSKRESACVGMCVMTPWQEAMIDDSRANYFYHCIRYPLTMHAPFQNAHSTESKEEYLVVPSEYPTEVHICKLIWIKHGACYIICLARVWMLSLLIFDSCLFVAVYKPIALQHLGS